MRAQDIVAAAGKLTRLAMLPRTPDVGCSLAMEPAFPKFEG